MPRKIDYTGKKYGALTLLAQVREGSAGMGVVWLAQCDCGKTREVIAKDVSRGRLLTCGSCQLKYELRGSGRSRKNKTDTAKRQVYAAYVRSAITRGIKWELIPEQFIKITQKNCTYCGTIPSNNWKRMGYMYNGVDRIDNTEGYTLDNCIPCCTMCNKMKMDHNLFDFLSKVSKIYERTEHILKHIHQTNEL